MTILCILLLPPLYFLNRKKWGAFLLNAIFYGLAWLCVLSVIGIAISPIFWLVAVIHAFIHYRIRARNELIEHSAEVLATKMAEKMSQTGR